MSAVTRVRVPERVPGRDELVRDVPVLGTASAQLVTDTREFRVWHVVWKGAAVARVTYALGGFRYSLLDADGRHWVMREPVLISMGAAVREAIWEIESIQ